MRTKGRATFWFAMGLVVCALPFAALPPLLARLSAEATMAGLWLLIWAACPVLAVLCSFFVARRGVPAILAWLPAPVGYLLLPLWGIRPEWPVLLIAAVVGLISGVAGEQWTLRKEQKR